MATHMAAGRLTARGRPAAAASLHTLRPRAAAVAALRRPTAALAAAVGAAAAFTVRASNSGGHQRPLTNQERKARRAEAQRLGRDLCTVQLGQKGLSPTFLEGFRLAVASNELVKLKVGACDEGPDEVAELLCRVGDCVVVHKIGFTLTFFRDKSLPPPPPFSPARFAAAAAARRKEQAAEVASDAAAAPSGAASGSGRSSKAAPKAAAKQEEQEGEAGSDCEDEADVADAVQIDAELALYLLENEDAYSDSDSEGEEEDDLGRPNSGKRQAAEARAARANRPPPPPEFTVIG